MEDRKEKMDVTKKKVALRGGMVRIEEDWIRKERAMQWKLEEMVKRERRSNRRAWVRYGRIWIEGKWWRWEEKREKLVYGKGEKRGWRKNSKEGAGEGKRIRERERRSGKVRKKDKEREEMREMGRGKRGEELK